MKYLLKLAFLGTAYHGFQVQNNAKTVQGALCEAAEAVFGIPCAVTGCSRTDSGVHANCYYATVDVSGGNNIPVSGIPSAFAHILPDDISVYGATVVPKDFHPRYDVLYKEYEYLIWNGKQRNPFLTDRAYHRPMPLDLNEMIRAADLFVGEHDFSAFMAAGSKISDTVRHIMYFNVAKDGDLVKFNVAADGFLYNMVRIMAGTLLAVSEGKIKAAEIPDIIGSKERKCAGATAPAEGLYLNKVVYRKSLC